MTEKVKLTQEQAWMIENHRGSFERLMRKRYMKNCPTYIDELTTQQVVDAYFGGYEVEETFDVGEWVRNSVTGKVARIDDRGYDEEVVWVDDKEVNFFSEFRRASPEEITEEKQRRWWAKHGRDVWELKMGDIIQGAFGQMREVCRVNELGEYVTLPNYTAFSKKELAEWKVICFIEDRKDLEGEQ